MTKGCCLKFVLPLLGSVACHAAYAQDDFDLDDLFAGEPQPAATSGPQGRPEPRSASETRSNAEDTGSTSSTSSTAVAPTKPPRVISLNEPEKKLPPVKNKPQLEEIVVTARKREESLQEIPLSVTPFSAAELEQRGMSGLDDIAAATPGFTFEAFQSGGAASNAVIRGLAQQFTTSRIQNVSFFLDGVYLQRQSMLDLGLIDMQRVEVVKGPQNALYGRNAFAGAVNYVTLRPGAQPEGYAMTTLGDNGREQYRVSFSGPLDESNTLFGKFTYGTSRYDGHTRNNHPVANADPVGDNVRGMLGGIDDQTYSVSLAYEPTDSLRTRASYYKSRLTHETGAGYGISGLRSVTFGFRYEDQNDLNCNQATLPLQGQDQNPLARATGNTLWCGPLPRFASDAGPRRINGIVVDPRAIGFRGDTNVVTFSTEYDIFDNLTAYYLYGQTDHQSYTDGGTSDEDPIAGRGIITDLTRYLADQSDPDAYVFANTASGRPNSVLESFSHELRFDWEFNPGLRASAGLYYSKVEDQEWTTIFVNDLCNADSDENIQNCNRPLLYPNTIAERTTLTVAPGFDLYFRQHGGEVRGEWSGFEDSIAAAFATVSYDLTPALELTIEGRFSQEEKSIDRFTDSFGLGFRQYIAYTPETDVGMRCPAGSERVLPPTGQTYPVAPFIGDPICSSLIVPSDSATFNYFTPRAIANWQYRDNMMVYGSVAKGVKSGGFNNAESVDELTYDEAENWTYEIGSKNTFFGGLWTLNGAIYLVDWSGLQGGIPPAIVSASASDIITNLGSAESLGIEFDTNLFLPFGFSFDLNGTYNDARYGDEVIYFAGNQDGKFVCDGTVCPSDGSVGGNQLARTSKVQAAAGINFNTSFRDWGLSVRLDTSYQSKQFLTPLNVGWVPDRQLTNFSFNLGSPDDVWEVNGWVKNLTNEDYAANSFVVGVFTQYLVGKGPGRQYGLAVKLKF